MYLMLEMSRVLFTDDIKVILDGPYGWAMVRSISEISVTKVQQQGGAVMSIIRDNLVASSMVPEIFKVISAA